MFSHLHNIMQLTIYLSQDAQEGLKTVTSETLTRVHQSQERLIAAQGHLERSQSQISSSMTSNMYALMREKALIAAGNQELTELTETIKQKLGQWLPVVVC